MNPAAPERAPTRAMLERLRTRYRERRAFRWSVDLGSLLIVVTLVSLFQTRHHVRGAPPRFPLATLEGKATGLDAFKGKKTLLYVWAPWCGVCRAQKSNVSWARSIVGDRANVVSIATAYESIDEVRAHGGDVPVFVSPLAERALRVSVFPTLYFLDAEGNVTRSASGYTTTAGLLWRLML